MQVDLSVVKGHRTYILMGANIACVGLESLGVIPEGTWIKITAVLVSLGIVTNRAGSKNDAAVVTEALAAIKQATASVTPVSEASPGEASTPEAVPDPIGDVMATAENIVAAYKESQANMEQLGQVMKGIAGAIGKPGQTGSAASAVKESAAGVEG